MAVGVGDGHLTVLLGNVQPRERGTEAAALPPSAPAPGLARALAAGPRVAAGAPLSTLPAAARAPAAPTAAPAAEAAAEPAAPAAASSAAPRLVVLAQRGGQVRVELPGAVEVLPRRRGRGRGSGPLGDGGAGPVRHRGCGRGSAGGQRRLGRGGKGRKGGEEGRRTEPAGRGRELPGRCGEPADRGRGAAGRGARGRPAGADRGRRVHVGSPFRLGVAQGTASATRGAGANRAPPRRARRSGGRVRYTVKLPFPGRAPQGTAASARRGRRRLGTGEGSEAYS